MIEWNKIEKKWRNKWTEKKIFESNRNNLDKKFITVAYPYPNSPQHVGHGRTYTITDIHARFWRMRGFNVLFPMGFHYTGTPILSISKKIQENDIETINGLKKAYNIPSNIIESFIDPIKTADYFHNEIKKGMIEMGYSIDWRREFTTIDTIYKKFATWQFNILKNKKLIIQGSHPVGWCPKDQNPVSQHDTKGDIEPKFLEYTIIKFNYNGYILPAATLRPETVFGITNVWVNPKIVYNIISVDNEKWIINTNSIDELKFQGKKVTKITKIKGIDIIGKKIKNPYNNKTIFVLPASFVNEYEGTGIVMSVPAHSPFDYQAIEDIKKGNDKSMKEIIKKINPIIVIDNHEYIKKIPTKTIIKKLGIKNQNDIKLEKATKELYLSEMRNGKLNKNSREFVGNSVEKAREIIKKWSINNDYGDTIFELTEKVICRCGSKCVVKILNNQWFLDYSNKKWKENTIKHMKQMDIIPKDVCTEFDNVVWWLKERACARQHGLGTQLPWDNKWIIESLSDSTIYMAYYIISRYINEKKINQKNIGDSFFNFVCLGIGDMHKVSKECNISNKLLDEIRKDFIYFYPVDYRHSGRDLIPNHLTFFVMNHIVIFPKKFWPKKIIVNGSVLMNGKKMSKSMMNTIPLREMIKKYGADPIRLAIISSSELLQDTDFNLKSVLVIQEKLNNILDKCTNYKVSRTKKLQNEDKWLQSRLYILIKNITNSIEKMRLREALHKLLFDFDYDINWYIRRINSKNKKPSDVVYKMLSNRIIMLSPFAPYITEEIWEKLGNSETITKQSWPDHSYKINLESIIIEDFLKNIINDINKICKVTKTIPKKIIIYIANTKKNNIYKDILQRITQHDINTKKIIKDLIINDIQYTKSNIIVIKKMIKDIIEEADEIKKLKYNKYFNEKEIIASELFPILKHELNVDVNVFSENDNNRYDPNDKAKNARPFKPAIFVE